MGPTLELTAVVVYVLYYWCPELPNHSPAHHWPSTAAAGKSGMGRHTTRTRSRHGLRTDETQPALGTAGPLRRPVFTNQGLVSASLEQWPAGRVSAVTQ